MKNLKEEDLKFVSGNGIGEQIGGTIGAAGGATLGALSGSGVGFLALGDTYVAVIVY
ncbi:hypothetical protein [Ursidibacter arcticus]|uniref:hypothetical protein n=1 Tax=Ursidibacter arcticus TaxID=1524965 RepID=UPI0012F8202C|nr:hypothetical protein [Ursidibacter arcticus]